MRATQAMTHIELFTHFIKCGVVCVFVRSSGFLMQLYSNTTAKSMLACLLIITEHKVFQDR